jgi:hypothetical protein
MSDTDLGNIFYTILAKDSTAIGTNAAKGNFAAMGLAIGAVTTAVGGAGVALIDKNNKLMGSLDAVSQETGISADSLRGLTMELANGKDSISEVSDTMATLGKFNITTADQMNTAAQAALALGDANNTTGSDIANSVVPALQAYGLTVDDLGAKSDSLTAITHSTKYGLTDVTNILAKTAPTAAAAGLSFDDMTSIIEALGQKGVPARNMVNEINTALKGFQKESDDAAKKSASLTETQDTLSKTLTDNKEKLVLLEAQHPKTGAAAATHAIQIKNLQDKIKDETDQFNTNKTTLEGYKSTLSDTTSVNDKLTAALGLQGGAMDKADAILKKSTGSTEAYNKIAEDHIGLMANVSSWWEKTTDNVGAALTPYSSMFTAMTAVGGVLTAANGLLMLNNTLHITSAVSTAASTVATEAATAAQWLFDAALDANPIGLVILAIAGLVAGIYLLDQKFHFIQPAIQMVSDAFTWVWNGIQGITNSVPDMNSILYAILVPPPLQLLIAAFKLVYDNIDLIMAAIPQLIKLLLDIVIPPPVQALLGAAGSAGAAFGNSISGHASGGPMAAGEPGIVGEKGPELWIPSTSGTVIPNGGNAKYGDLVININGTESKRVTGVSKSPGNITMLLDLTQRGY